MHATGWLSLSLFVLCLWANTAEVEAWSGHVCRRRQQFYYTVRVCVRRWWGCRRWETRWRCGYRWVNYCCPGWRNNGNNNCNIPICYKCYNGGTCVAPGKCACTEGFSGDMCITPLCSWDRPCYPGRCGGQADECECVSNYGGSYCDTLEKGEEPEMTSTSAVMWEKNRVTDSTLYSITTDATNPNIKTTEVFWTNLQFFNFLSVNWETFYGNRTDLPPLPSYIGEARFGIVAAYCEVLHVKRKGSGTVVAERINYNCSSTLSDDNPEEDIANCTVDAEDFFNSVEHRDVLTITARAQNGGYLSRKSDHRIRKYFKGLSYEKKMQFEFDFEQPYHCKVEGTCTSDPISVDGDDIRKDGFTMRWPGWDDAYSGIERYVLRLFLLKADRDGFLTEGENPVPVYTAHVNKTGSGQESHTWTPQTRGMYSIYLRVSDRANNSQFGRALVLYDPVSSVELNDSPSSRLFVASARPETNYQWQQNTSEPVLVRWGNHFRNKFHEDNSLLSKVLPFSVQDETYERGNRAYISHKEVQKEYDDNTGNRTVDAIPNSHGIVKFEIAYRSDTELGKSCLPSSPASNWKTLANITSEEYVVKDTPRHSGSTLCVWVRATDVLGNKNVDVTMVSFDDTAPLLESDPIQRNVEPPGQIFQSTLECDTRDPDSGIKELEWFLVDDATDRQFASGTVDTTPPENVKCTALSDICACAPVNSDNCYRSRYQLYIPHCAINVSKAEVTNLVVRVDIEVTNRAGLKKSYPSQKIGNITRLRGINSYVAPQRFRQMDVGTTSATIQWENPPSCYLLSAIFVSYRPTEGGEFTNETVYNQNTEVSFNSLLRGTKYSMWISNVYSTERSDPSEFFFETESFESGEIAGLIVGLLLLLVIAALLIAMFVLWRRGKLRTTLRRTVTRINRVRGRPVDRRTIFKNLGHDEELYVYGNRPFDPEMNWFLRGADLDIQEIIAEGRFARVYKAMLATGGSFRTVAAKMLLPTNSQVETEVKIMTAKINFMAENEFVHDHVVQFLGAINDDPERGPIMLLEYCENGTLKKWLTAKREAGRVSEDIVDRLFHIVFGITKGMDYLSSKGVVHRKLAARNILLDFGFSPKIIGFGPVPDELSEEGADGKGERLPLKWMAPELVKARSTKKATEKSDVWSFGVVAWEVFSLGGAPFNDIKGSDLHRKLNQGVRLKRPEFMSDDYDVITKRCWNQMPEDRPSFSHLVKEQSLLFDDSGRCTSYYDSSVFKHYQED